MPRKPDPREELKRVAKALADELPLMHLDPEADALVENVAMNLGLAVRPTRNELAAGVEASQFFEELVDETDVTLTPQEEARLQMSFEGHLRAMQRMLADQIGQAVEAGAYFGDKPKGDLVVLKLEQHAAGNYPNLGSHPRDETLPIPIPNTFEREAPEAAEILKLHPKDQKRALDDYVAKLLNRTGATYEP